MEGAGDGARLLGASGTRASHGALRDWNAARDAHCTVVGAAGGGIHLCCNMVGPQTFTSANVDVGRHSWLKRNRRERQFRNQQRTAPRLAKPPRASPRKNA